MPHTIPTSTEFGVALPLFEARVQFRYVNWRGVEHTYIIDVESVELGPYDTSGMHRHADRDREDFLKWVLHGQVYQRDGDDRPELQDHPGNRRRTFLMEGVKDLELVGPGAAVPVWQEGDTSLGPRRCPHCSSIGTGQFMPDHILEEHS